ncbi:MAG: hypothetical protein JOZ40_09025, partial [Methylobacteriaceae bacterium]|nr:hypothetical protein [Methylobacteriaceae bacterium]
CGFVASNEEDGAVFRLFDMSGNNGRLVSFAESARCAAVLLGSLHYRADRIAAISDLGRSPIAPGQAVDGADSDAALALAAYAHSGSRGLAGLEGDFCLVVWDGERQCFLARRDPLGAYPLFWTRVGSSTVFATGLRALLALAPSNALDEDYFVDFLIGTTLASRTAAESSPYKGVHRVTTTEILTIDITGGRCTHDPCWNWRDQVSDPGTDRIEEIAPVYRDLLRAAVRERIHGRTAAHLSGGMDSTTTCLLALDCIERGRGELPLHALSLVYDRRSTLALETPFIDSILEGAGDRLCGHRIAGDDILHFDVLDDPPVHDEPCAALWAFGQERALLEASAGLGVDTVLTGEGADDLLHVSPNHIADLLARWRLGAAWKSACAWARARGSNPWSIVRRYGLAPAFARRGGMLAQGLPAGRQAAPSDQWSVPAWISAEFSRRHELAARSADNRSRIYRLGPSIASSLALHGIERRIGEAQRSILAAPRGIALAHPFLDPRVMRLALGVQCRLQAPSALRKPLLAEAMRGVLPEAIRTRRSTRPFNEILYPGYSRNLAKLRRLINSPPIDDLGMIDRKVLIDCVEKAALGAAMPSRLRRLNETLSLITWLSMRAKWETRPMAPGEVIRMPAVRARGAGAAAMAAS